MRPDFDEEGRQCGVANESYAQNKLVSNFEKLDL